MAIKNIPKIYSLFKYFLTLIDYGYWTLLFLKLLHIISYGAFKNRPQILPLAVTISQLTSLLSVARDQHAVKCNVKTSVKFSNIK